MIYVPENNSIKRSILYPLPNTPNGPVGNFYAEIIWENGYENWALVRFSTPMDGSCLFHAITNAFFPLYYTETKGGKHVSRSTIIKSLRKELSQKLAVKINNEPNAPNYYDTLNKGNTSLFAKEVPEFSLDHMQKELNSNTSIGYGYIEYIGNILDKDIYVLEASRHNIYITDELSLTIKGNRPSIVLYYMDGHYELVGIRNDDMSFVTHFSCNHSFIRFLHEKIIKIINK